MALWCRLKQPQLKSLSNHLKRCFFSPILLTQHPRISTITQQDSILNNTHFKIPQNFRSFAVPAQFKPKQEEEEDDGPRLNEKITAPSVRLVLDQGHTIVSRREALERAKSVDQDLVEVDRNAKPPVCKIMDYHREQYVKKLKEKERTKSKAEVTLKKGSSKSVQFESKIEEKDLQMKAATVKKMMESGYRVKAMPNEDENLPGLLARFCALIADVAVIESGPIIERKGAYVVVRHVKYGLPKKGSKKTFQLQATSNQAKEVSYSEADMIPVNESSMLDDLTPTSHPPEPSLEIENRYKKDQGSRSLPYTELNVASPPCETENRYKKDQTTRSPSSAEINVAGPSLETENRYRKDPINRSSPTQTNFASADTKPLQPQSPYQGRQPQQYPNQERQVPQYPNQGRQPLQHPDLGRQPQQYPDQGRQLPKYPSQGRSTQPYPNQGRQAPEYPNQGRPYPGASPNSSGGSEPNSTTEPQPAVVNRYKKAVNQHSGVPNFHGRGHGR
ncbi:hypothetical protein DCAR_0313430 [Daucus carota subsp. sativus]|uniref:Translation initiation factor 3 N-terminal domain-containing protein n=1 Tax=Daucus carota subsp. sativus TaxID=79200 RepID=A0AAF0WQY5_DAUCS|nr:hypothetical protein DCAR_0313430 [Daucus carota subsp. sativus]